MVRRSERFLLVLLPNVCLDAANKFLGVLEDVEGTGQTHFSLGDSY